MAPRLADFTLLANFDKTPFSGGLLGFFQFFNLCSISSGATLRINSSFSASINIVSPS